MKKFPMAVVAMCMTGGAYAADFSALPVNTDLKARFSAEGIPIPAVFKDYVELVEPATPIEWVVIPGGKFTMGTTSFEAAKPVHEVTVKTFEMSKTAVTVAQYAECVIKGGCTKPATDYYCNWGGGGPPASPGQLRGLVPGEPVRQV